MTLNYALSCFGVILYFFSLLAGAREVVVAFPQHIPPWVIQGDNTGISLDIVAHALAFRGHKLVPKFVPFARMSVVMADAGIDAVTMVEGKKVTGDYFYSDITTRFTTSLISLKREDRQIEAMPDLKDKRVMAFQDANKVFRTWPGCLKPTPNIRKSPTRKARWRCFLSGGLI